MATTAPPHSVRVLISSHFGADNGYQKLMATSLENLGLEVTRLAHPTLGAHLRFYRSTGRYHGVSPRQWLGLTVRALSLIRRHRIQVVLIMGSNYWMGPTTLRLIRALGCRVALLEGNLGFTAGFQVDALRFTDLIAIRDSYILPFLERMVGHQSVMLIRQALAAPELFAPPPADEVRSSPYTDSLSFVGNYFPNREQLLADIDRPVRVWGHGWDRSSLSGRESIRPIPFDDKPLLYAGSKINLHLTTGRHQVNGFSSRISEVPLCGGFVLAESTPDLEELRRGGLEVATFTTPEEARRLIDYFLDHEQERQAISRRAREHLLAEHRYETFAAELALRLVQLVHPHVETLDGGRGS